MQEKETNIDFIGDIHGHKEELKELLSTMGYEQDARGVYRHPDRKAFFLGDYIDRGYDNLGVIYIVKGMVEAGSARAILGNHEFNALGFHTSFDTGSKVIQLREHSEKNIKQHHQFLDEMSREPESAAKAIEWLSSLPLYIEEDGFICVHAAWHAGSASILNPLLNKDRSINPDALPELFYTGSMANRAVEVLLKGPEVDLPEQYLPAYDKDGFPRKTARIAWWKEQAPNQLPLSHAFARVPDAIQVSNEIAREYHYSGDKPVFFGHYWLKGTPRVISPKAICLDYSVAKDGALVAYRWSGEQEAKSENFVSVPANKGEVICATD